MSNIVDLFWKKKAQEDFEEIEGPKRERRFRASIYVDVWVIETDNIENDREVARKEVEEYQKEIPNSYIGNIGAFKGLTLDREI